MKKITECRVCHQDKLYRTSISADQAGRASSTVECLSCGAMFIEHYDEPTSIYDLQERKLIQED